MASADIPQATDVPESTGASTLHSKPADFSFTPSSPGADKQLPAAQVDDHGNIHVKGDGRHAVEDKHGIANIGKNGTLDISASPQDLINSGIFGAHGASANLDQAHQDKLRTVQDKITTMHVVSGDAASSKNANFIVDKNGAVTVVCNPDNNKGNQLTVVVQKVTGGESEPEKKAVDALAKYIEAHYDMAGQNIDDPDRLVSEAIKTSDNTSYSSTEKNAIAAAWGVPPANAVQEPAPYVIPPGMPAGGAEIAGGAYPRVPQGTARGYPAEYPQTRNPIAQNRFAWNGYGFDGATSGAGFINNDISFNFSGALLADWLMNFYGININDPHYADKLRKLEATNPKLANQLTQIAGVARRLEKGEQVNSADMAGALPKELAQKIAHAEVEKFSSLLKDPKTGKVDAGKLALALDIGRVPTAADLANPKYKQLMENARIPDANKAILTAAQANVGRSCYAEWAKKHGVSLSALEDGNLGCGAAVGDLGDKVGLPGLGSASARGVVNNAIHMGGHFVDAAHAKPGDLIFFDGRGAQHDHIAIYAGGNEAYANHSGNGTLELNTIASMDRGRPVKFIRLPAQTQTNNLIASNTTSQ